MLSASANNVDIISYQTMDNVPDRNFRTSSIITENGSSQWIFTANGKSLAFTFYPVRLGLFATDLPLQKMPSTNVVCARHWLRKTTQLVRLLKLDFALQRTPLDALRSLYFVTLPRHDGPTFSHTPPVPLLSISTAWSICFPFSRGVKWARQTILHRGLWFRI